VEEPLAFLGGDFDYDTDFDNHFLFRQYAGNHRQDDPAVTGKSRYVSVF
jgi:hypothetical protein